MCPVSETNATHIMYTSIRVRRESQAFQLAKYINWNHSTVHFYACALLPDFEILSTRKFICNLYIHNMIRHKPLVRWVCMNECDEFSDGLQHPSSVIWTIWTTFKLLNEQLKITANFFSTHTNELVSMCVYVCDCPTESRQISRTSYGFDSFSTKFTNRNYVVMCACMCACLSSNVYSLHYTFVRFFYSFL